MYVEEAVELSLGEKVGVPLGSIDGLVFGCVMGINIGSTDGKIRGTAPGFADGIKLGLMKKLIWVFQMDPLMVLMIEKLRGHYWEY